MITAEQESLERTLDEQTNCQIQLHLQALETARQLTQTLANTGEFEPLTRQLEDTMQQVHQQEIKLKPLREEWNRLGFKSNGSLKSTVEKAKVVLADLLAEIQRSEDLMQDTRSKLVPELNQEARMAKMRQMYAHRF